MRFLGVMYVLWALAGPVLAQKACGPVIRALEGDYFLVQCNGAAMQPNDQVSIRRDGQEVARGTVMRSEGNLCSVLVREGEAQRMDVVYLLSPTTDAARGPALPSFGKGQGAGAIVPATASMSSGSNSASSDANRSKRDSFFSGVGSGGRVLNLNTGEVITER